MVAAVEVIGFPDSEARAVQWSGFLTYHACMKLASNVQIDSARFLGTECAVDLLPNQLDY